MSIKKRVIRIEDFLKRKRDLVDPIKYFYDNYMTKGSKFESLYAHPVASAYGNQNKETFLVGYPESLRIHLWELCREALRQVGQQDEVDVIALSGQLTPEKLRGQLTECFRVGVGIGHLDKKRTKDDEK